MNYYYVNVGASAFSRFQIGKILSARTARATVCATTFAGVITIMCILHAFPHDCTEETNARTLSVGMVYFMCVMWLT